VDPDDFSDEAPTNPPGWDPDDQPPSTYEAIEEQFLADIRAAPADFALRVVYADWLEQQGKLRKATLARLLSVDPIAGSPERVEIRELGSQIPHDWMATLARGEIDGCEQERQRECSQRWETLASTEQPRVRRCPTCERAVHFCGSLAAVGAHEMERVVYGPLLDPADGVDYYDGRRYLDAGQTRRERSALRLPGSGPLRRRV
jgi:uncharacterized protein (TIGR02996 family)